MHLPAAAVRNGSTWRHGCWCGRTQRIRRCKSRLDARHAAASWLGSGWATQRLDRCQPPTPTLCTTLRPGSLVWVHMASIISRFARSFHARPCLARQLVPATSVHPRASDISSTVAAHRRPMSQPGAGNIPALGALEHPFSPLYQRRGRLSTFSLARRLLTPTSTFLFLRARAFSLPTLRTGCNFRACCCPVGDLR